MVEGAPLLREYTPKGYRGFESLLLRHEIRNYLRSLRFPDCSVTRIFGILTRKMRKTIFLHSQKNRPFDSPSKPLQTPFKFAMTIIE